MEGSQGISVLQLKAEIDQLREDCRRLMGRDVAHEIALASALRMWGKPASVVADEIRRSFGVVASSAAQQGMSESALAEFNQAASTIHGMIQAAADESV